MHLKIYVTENIFLCTLFHQSLCISFNRLELTQEITFPINVDCITKIVFYTDGFKSNVVLWYFLDRHQVWRSHDPTSVRIFTFVKDVTPPFFVLFP